MHIRKLRAEYGRDVLVPKVLRVTDDSPSLSLARSRSDDRRVLSMISKHSNEGQ